MSIFETIAKTYGQTTTYLGNEFTQPSWHNYFVLLVGISVLVWILEICFPWRKQQNIFRRDFFLDAFYMVFQFFIAPWLFLNVIYAIVNQHILMDANWSPLISLNDKSFLIQMFLIFILQDFTHYWIHRALHRFPILWRFHKVHHSVLEMGFAAHLRFHWMENIVYRSVTAIPWMLVGFSAIDLYPLHVLTLAIGHLNHANLKWTYGPLKYVLNHPTMHLWHHVKSVPKGFRYGLNYGISLSVWDIIFKTAKMDRPQADLSLGFEKVETFPKTFLGQNINPLGPKHP